MKIKALILLLIFSATGIAKFSVVTNYVIDYEYYVTVLCENKDKSGLSCNGSCVFMKEMGLTGEAESGSDQNKPAPPENEQQLQAFDVPELSTTGLHLLQMKTRLNINFTEKVKYEFCSKPFKPPQA